MSKVSESNYLQLLQETISALGAVSDFLSSNKAENRAELSNISQATKQIQGVLRSQRVKAIRSKMAGHYSQKIQEEQARKSKLLDQMRQLREKTSDIEI